MQLSFNAVAVAVTIIAVTIFFFILPFLLAFIAHLLWRADDYFSFSRRVRYFFLSLKSALDKLSHKRK